MLGGRVFIVPGSFEKFQIIVVRPQFEVWGWKYFCSNIFQGCCEIEGKALRCIAWVFDREGAVLRKRLYFPEIRSFLVLGMKKRRQQ